MDTNEVGVRVSLALLAKDEYEIERALEERAGLTPRRRPGLTQAEEDDLYWSEYYGED